MVLAPLCVPVPVLLTRQQTGALDGQTAMNMCVCVWQCQRLPNLTTPGGVNSFGLSPHLMHTSLSPMNDAVDWKSGVVSEQGAMVATTSSGKLPLRMPFCLPCEPY